MAQFTRSTIPLKCCCLLIAVSACGPSEPPPTQQQVQEAWKRTDQAAQQSHDAEQKRDETQRLREVDRVRDDAAQLELQQQRLTLAGWSIGVTLLAAALMFWLAIELRRRRIAQAALHALLDEKGVPSRPSTDPMQLPDSPS